MGPEPSLATESAHFFAKFSVKELGVRDKPFEKRVKYGDINVHIRIPEAPTGLVFIAPGAQVRTDSPLVETLRESCENKGRAAIVADMSETELKKGSYIHENFAVALQQVIDGYMADNDYQPEQFDLIGHSMSGAAALTIAPDYPVSQITVLDPTPIKSEVLGTVPCSVHMILSNVRSFKNTGTRMFSELNNLEGIRHTLHNIQTSADRYIGHMFTGHEDEVAHIIDEQEIPFDDHNIWHDDLPCPD